MASEDPLLRKPCKVWSSDRKIRKAVVVSSLRELVERGAAKLGYLLSPSEIRVVLEQDGTDVEDETYFRQLPPNTVYLLLQSGEHWLPPSVEAIKAAITAIPQIVCDAIASLELFDKTPSWKIEEHRGKVTIVLTWDPEDRQQPPPTVRVEVSSDERSGGRTPKLTLEGLGPRPSSRSMKVGVAPHTHHVHAHHHGTTHAKDSSPSGDGTSECDFHCSALHHASSHGIHITKSVATSPILEMPPPMGELLRGEGMPTSKSPKPPPVPPHGPTTLRSVRFMEQNGAGGSSRAMGESITAGAASSFHLTSSRPPLLPEDSEESEEINIEDYSERYLLLVDQLSMDQNKHLSIKDIGVILERLNSKIVDVDRLERDKESTDIHNWTIKATLKGEVIREIGVIYNGHYYGIMEHPGSSSLMVPDELDAPLPSTSGTSLVSAPTGLNSRCKDAVLILRTLQSDIANMIMLTEEQLERLGAVTVDEVLELCPSLNEQFVKDVLEACDRQLTERVQAREALQTLQVLQRLSAMPPSTGAGDNLDEPDTHADVVESSESSSVADRELTRQVVGEIRRLQTQLIPSGRIKRERRDSDDDCVLVSESLIIPDSDDDISSQETNRARDTSSVVVGSHTSRDRKTDVTSSSCQTEAEVSSTNDVEEQLNTSKRSIGVDTTGFIPTAGTSTNLREDTKLLKSKISGRPIKKVTTAAHQAISKRYHDVRSKRKQVPSVRLDSRIYETSTKALQPAKGVSKSVETRVSRVKSSRKKVSAAQSSPSVSIEELAEATSSTAKKQSATNLRNRSSKRVKAAVSSSALTSKTDSIKTKTTKQVTASLERRPKHSRIKGADSAMAAKTPVRTDKAAQMESKAVEATSQNKTSRKRKLDETSTTKEKRVVTKRPKRN